jgi:hypothetical protein
MGAVRADAPPVAGPGALGARGDRGLSALVLLAAALVGFGPLVWLLLYASRHGLVFAGAESPFAADQYQYMTWIREFGHGPLAANPLDVVPQNHVFLHPMFLVSGLLWRIGVSMPVAYLLWKPVALVVLFLGARAYIWRFVSDRADRFWALAIALLFAAPAAALADWASLGSGVVRADFAVVAAESMPAAQLWGYFPTALAIGLMALFLVRVERLDSRRDVALASVFGALAAWLHPWQGEVLLITLVAGVALDWRSLRGRLLRLAIPAAAVLAPLVYYLVLSRVDDSWHLAQTVNATTGRLPWWTIALGLAPLALPALAGVRWPVGLGERMLLILPMAAAAVYLLFSPSFPQHALEGLTLPLAVLAVRGVRRLPRRAAWAAALTALLVVPGTIYLVSWWHDTAAPNIQANWLVPGENDALRFLDHDPAPGAVLPVARLGALVPQATGRETWLGHYSWTRDYGARAKASEALFSGTLPPAAAVALARSSGATFLLRDCRHPAAALDRLRPAVLPVRQFGCAGVYRLTR